MKQAKRDQHVLRSQDISSCPRCSKVPDRLFQHALLLDIPALHCATFERRAYPHGGACAHVPPLVHSSIGGLPRDVDRGHHWSLHNGVCAAHVHHGILLECGLKLKPWY